jgi:CubicO group peptidase (beta-lactamase class C family)
LLTFGKLQIVSPSKHLKMKPSFSPVMSWICSLLILVLTSCSQEQGQLSSLLPRSTPEAEGVSSQGILDFLDAAEDSDTEFHSFMLVRHGKVIAEGWWDPYRSDLRHTLYSTSKSFTSTAAGLAVGEERINLDDHVISFFPDELPDTISPFLEEMTLRDLLTMSAGLDPDPTRLITSADSNWVRAFLALPMVNEPGSTFLYNSMATYMVSAIVQQATGEKVLDYLVPRLFEPLSITGMDWEMDAKGINTGGWGLRLKTEDMAKFGLLYLQQGVWEGNQILPEGWVEEATTLHIEQAPDAPAEVKANSDWLQGYGYQFWRCRHDAFRADGAFGQFIVVMPEKEAVVAITAESPDMQSELNLVWDFLLPAMGEDPLAPDPLLARQLKERTSSLALSPASVTSHSELANEVSNLHYNFEPNEQKLKSLMLAFTEQSCEVTLLMDGTSFPLSFGYDHWITQQTGKPGPNLLNNAIGHFQVLPEAVVAGSYTWKDPQTLELVLRYIESPHREVYRIGFNEQGISMEYRTSLSPPGSAVLLHGRLMKQ